MHYRLAPSILAANFIRLGEQMKEVYGVGAEYLYLDVMDGAFAPDISFGMSVIRSLCLCTRAISDVHMMVGEPRCYVGDMKDCRADVIIVQTEVCTHLNRAVNQTKEAGLKADVALNLATPVRSPECIFGQLNTVLIITANPGFGDQKFIPYTFSKVRELRSMLSEQGLKMDTQMDGDVDAGDVREIMDAGASIFVVGSAVFGRGPSARTGESMDILKEYEK